MLKAAVVVLTNRRVIAQQLVAAQNQLTKIYHAFALALRFVQLVNFYFFTRLVIAHFNVFGALALFFAAADKVHHLLGWKALFIYTKLFHQALDRRQLVLRVQNLKRLRQTGHLVVCP